MEVGTDIPDVDAAPEQSVLDEVSCAEGEGGGLLGLCVNVRVKDRVKVWVRVRVSAQDHSQGQD